MPGTRRQPSASRSSSDAHLDHLSTEVLRLRLDQLKLVTTGSRSTLLGHLRAALREKNDLATSQDTSPATDQEPSIPRLNDHSTVQSPPPGSFTPDQLSTLKCLIASSIQDARSASYIGAIHRRAIERTTAPNASQHHLFTSQSALQPSSRKSHWVHQKLWVHRF